MFTKAICFLLLAYGGWALAQEGHGYTPADVERGEQIYFSNCSTCHGPEGDGISGVNLGSGRFRRANSDEELMNVIRNGIPGTPMPPGNYPAGMAQLIVAYLRSMSTGGPASRGPSMAGDGGRGKALFEGRGRCLECHRVNGSGGFLGPDLSGIGGLRRAAALERSILDPSAEVRADNRTARLIKSDGTSIAGRLLNQDTYSLQVIDAGGKLISVSKDGLRGFEIMKGSAMPEYKGKMTAQEVADLVAYLTSLTAR